MTQQTQQPKYKVLNAQRTQGDWRSDGNYIQANFHDGNHGSAWLDIIKCQILPSNCMPEGRNEAEANAEYTALAVNNLHHLAEALENFLALSNDKNGISLQGQKAFYELKKHCPEVWSWLEQAQQALARIS